MRTTFLFPVLTIVFAVGASAGVLYAGVSRWDDITARRATQPSACTKEAKVCPDGSVVERQGPRCVFAPCPTGNASGTAGNVNINPGANGNTNGPSAAGRCATYEDIDGRKEYCATCGDGVCTAIEQCTSSSVKNVNGDIVSTNDCGPLYCPRDCGLS